MTYNGKVINGRVELPASVQLPEGAEVRVEVYETSGAADEHDPVYSIGDLAVDTGTADLSKNLDHYLYGHPKVHDDD